MGPYGAFTALVEHRHGIARIAVSGDLDVVTAPELEESIGRCSGPGIAGVMVDLRDVTFMDSSGIHALTHGKARVESEGNPFLLIGATPAVRRLLEITEQSGLFEVQEAVSLIDRFTGTGHFAAEQAVLDGGSSA